jgi:hypothetical protein
MEELYFSAARKTPECSKEIKAKRPIKPLIQRGCSKSMTPYKPANSRKRGDMPCTLRALPRITTSRRKPSNAAKTEESNSVNAEASSRT